MYIIYIYIKIINNSVCSDSYRLMPEAHIDLLTVWKTKYCCSLYKKTNKQKKNMYSYGSTTVLNLLYLLTWGYSEIYVFKVKVWYLFCCFPRFTLKIISGAVSYSPLLPSSVPLSLCDHPKRHTEAGRGKEQKVQSLKSKVQTVKGTKKKFQQN